MSADALITRDGPVAVPMDYNIPASSEIIPLLISATFDDPTNAGPYVPAVIIETPAGIELGPFPLSQAIAAGASARVSWFPGAGQLAELVSVEPGVTLETFFYDVASLTPALSTMTLLAGVSYLVIVEGTFTVWNSALGNGTPEANAMFPGSTAGRVSTQVGIDADTEFANPAGPPDTIGHRTRVQLSLDGGSTYAHIEPVGGPYSVPVAGHLYRYTLTGEGHKLGIQNTTALGAPTCYGELRVTIQAPNGTGTGSGAGSLLPPADATNNGEVPAVIGGVPAWSAVDGGSP